MKLRTTHLSGWGLALLLVAAPLGAADAPRREELPRNPQQLLEYYKRRAEAAEAQAELLRRAQRPPVPAPAAVASAPAPAPAPVPVPVPASAPLALPPQEDIHGWSTARVQALQRDTARALGREVVRPEAGQKMVLIPSGCYQMGSPKSEAERPSDEGPQRKVCVQAFELGKHEVTFAQWDACEADGGCGGYRPEDRGWGRGNRPVINVSWNDAQRYVAWLNGKTGGGYRLPSEAEWEYAARAGTTGPFSFSGPITAEKVNYDANYQYEGSPKGLYRGQTVEVGSLPANPLGLHEMHGNVWEWVADCWHDSYNGNPPTDGSEWKGGCTTDDGRVFRVFRGGSWLDIPRYVRSAGRGGNTLDIRGGDVGFRLARTLP